MNVYIYIPANGIVCAGMLNTSIKFDLHDKWKLPIFGWQNYGIFSDL